ncbi:MAG: N-acetylmuramoyl-L-alanine amidase [Bacteroidota bacterium]
MKKPIRILVTLAAVAVGFAFTLPFKAHKKQITIVLDAAHGGRDYGSAHGTFYEKQIAAAVSDRIQELSEDVEVVFYETRPDDTFVSLEDRVKVINDVKPDLVLSLHTNYERNGEKSGMDFYISDKSSTYDKSKEYADRLSAAFASKEYATEVKTAPFWVLKKSEAPTVMIEMGYLSNKADRNYLTTPAGQDAIATTVATFIKTLK